MKSRNIVAVDSRDLVVKKNKKTVNSDMLRIKILKVENPGE